MIKDFILKTPTPGNFLMSAWYGACAGGLTATLTQNAAYVAGSTLAGAVVGAVVGGLTTNSKNNVPKP
jgi:hypothetical protein